LADQRLQAPAEFPQCGILSIVWCEVVLLLLRQNVDRRAGRHLASLSGCAIVVHDRSPRRLVDPRVKSVRITKGRQRLVDAEKDLLDDVVDVGGLADPSSDESSNVR